MGGAGVKTCTKCKEEKPLEAFPPDPKHKDGRQSHCRACKAKDQAARMAGKSPEDKAYAMRAYRAGMRQGKCAVCGTAIEGAGICETCRECVDVLGGLEGLKRAVRAVRFLDEE
jgi:hypothetical protein